MVDPTQTEVDAYVLSLDKAELEYERQKKEVREFWDRNYNRRRKIEARIRLERIRRIRVALKTAGGIMGIIGAILFGAAVVWLAGVVRGIF